MNRRNIDSSSVQCILVLHQECLIDNSVYQCISSQSDKSITETAKDNIQHTELLKCPQCL